MPDGRGPISIATPDWSIRVQHDLPAIFEHHRSHATLLEEFDLAECDGEFCFVAAGPAGEEWPRLVIAQRYKPAGFGFNPGVAFIPDTGVLFVGAGTRLLGYSLLPSPRRLWGDVADMGFWHWSVHPDAVLMTAELELAAWTWGGVKLWSTFVEPPWAYSVDSGRVRLDVMGTVSEFGVIGGPAGE